MQIFFLSLCPKEAAKMACDKHVVNQPKETLQIISTVWYVLHKSQYKKYFKFGWLVKQWTNLEHPVILWTISSLGNYAWLLDYFGAILEEYTLRYGKFHAYQSMYANIRTMMPDPSISGPFEPMKREFQAIPEELKSDDPVTAYRAYYKRDKARFAKWAHSETPNWWNK